VYGNEQEHVKNIRSTCVLRYMSGYHVIIPVSDNYKSSVLCKMPGDSTSGDIRQVSNNNMSGDNIQVSGVSTVSASTSGESTSNDNTIDINCRTTRNKKTVPI